jgi:hypothetical protein
MNHDIQAYALAGIGILVPAAYVVFIICLTRRDREFSKMDDFFALVAKLHKSMHTAFMGQKRGAGE